MNCDDIKKSCYSYYFYLLKFDLIRKINNEELYNCINNKYI